jgi:YHS domain-containing protein
MIRDPECGTYVPRNDAIKTHVEGKACYFCSEECRDKYLERS